MLDFGLPYSGKNMKIESGDKLFLFTDGIPEAMYVNEGEYSDERMTKFFKDHSDKPSQEFINLIVENVRGYAGKAEQGDDITAMILKRF